MERQTALEAVVSIGIVVGFIGVLAALTTMYSTGGSLEPTGGYALIASLVAFVVVMSGAGLVLTRMDEADDGASGDGEGVSVDEEG
ncbi:MAG: hypothetical protein ABEJ47_00450 [Halorhabdus sp.]